MDLREKARATVIFIPALFFAMKEKETPIAAKIAAGIAVGYALSPIDLIPDFIPVLGYLDDLIILPLLVSLAVRLVPPEIMGKCKTEAEEMWSVGQPKRWYYALPVVVIWVAVLAAILYRIL